MSWFSFQVEIFNKLNPSCKSSQKSVTKAKVFGVEMVLVYGF